MSVIVKGMEMPQNCQNCMDANLNIAISLFGAMCPFCEKIFVADINIRKQRHPDCPLVEIPTPHGRLIDADKFAETLKEVSIRQGYDKLFSDNILSVGDVFDAIAADLKGEGLDKYKLAPTVIEAEGET